MREPTFPMFHFIIPDGEQMNFEWNGECCGTIHAIEPIQMLEGTWAVPHTVTHICHLPQTYRDALVALNNIQQLNCCDFNQCEHPEE